MVSQYISLNPRPLQVAVLHNSYIHCKLYTLCPDVPRNLCNLHYMPSIIALGKQK